MTKRYVQKREDKRPAELPAGSNWLNDPASWDFCDRHETAFPMAEKCPECSPTPQEAPQK